MTDLIYRPDIGQNVVDFFPQYLKHFKGEWAGQPFELEEWEAEPLRRIFGTLRPDGTRAIQETLWAVARKNGKSHLAAGLGLYMLFADQEPGAEVFCCAADREQAAIVFQCAREFVEASPVLSSRCEVYRRAIVVPKTASSLKVLSAEAYTKHGLNASAVLFDELHCQPNRELYDTMKTSMGSRRQPLLFNITTAGWDRHSICWEIWDYAIKVRDGIIEDESFLPVIYETDPEDDWTLEETWAKANPNLGVSVKPEFLRKECRRAVETPSFENTFRRLYLNQWTEQSCRWLSMDKWRECANPVSLESLEGESCYAGLDLSATTDLSALGLLFPRPGGYHYFPFFWMPEEGIHRRSKRDRVPLDDWAKAGFIEATPGEAIDYDRIRARINELGERFQFMELAIDRWNATQITTQLDGDGFNVLGYGQGFASMSSPSKELEKLVLTKGLAHNANPVLDWMASNVAIKEDAAGNIKPDKANSGDRIDGIVALVMALGRAMVQPEHLPGYSEERGLRTL